MTRRRQEPLRKLRGPGGLLAEVQAAGAGHATRRLYGDGRANVGRVALTQDDGSPATLEPPRLYEAFGARRDPTVSLVERGFAGSVVEGPSGLVHLGARHYDPATGTFLQPDPLYLETGERTAYARQNPYRFVDPTGLGPQGINQQLVRDFSSIAAQPQQATRELSSQGQFPQLAGGDSVAQAQALRQSQGREQIIHGNLVLQNPENPFLDQSKIPIDRPGMDVSDRLTLPLPFQQQEVILTIRNQDSTFVGSLRDVFGVPTDLTVDASSFDPSGTRTLFESRRLNEFFPLREAIRVTLGIFPGPGELRVLGGLEGRGRLTVNVRVIEVQNQ